MTLLAAEAFDLAHGEALHADAGERLFDLVELERFDDRYDHFHVVSSALHGDLGRIEPALGFPHIPHLAQDPISPPSCAPRSVSPRPQPIAGCSHDAGSAQGPTSLSPKGCMPEASRARRPQAPAR